MNNLQNGHSLDIFQRHLNSLPEIHRPTCQVNAENIRGRIVFILIIVFSRIMILWGYANISEAAQQSFGIKLMVLRCYLFVHVMTSWSLVEVPRYLFYIVKTLNIPMPTWLLFLRYNLFYILYPTGITGEILVILASLPFVKSSHIFSMSLPNPWNFAFNYYGVSLFWLFLYVPRLFFLFV